MTDFDSHLMEQRMENYAFLLSTGMHPDRIARRLGISRNTLNKELERRRRREQQPHPVGTTESGEGS